ncbi:hypothetical protein [Taibaiella chishuiensis]|uniref:Uncharacterized protein n=1 Tax=Taibaiella chishuiensis TaxID=1434707 RepID=A0A2P8CW57_9BACT|nr:hypothetical protein [Taibaiella chishuiensis]PSK89201.1 hypothetical protein B0I18_1122 [Taibaiella chishuiensis]
MKSRIILTLFALLLFAACEKQPDQYPDEPQIYYKNTTPRTIGIEDTTVIKILFGFTDGDGNIGWDENRMAIFAYNVFDPKDTTRRRDTFAFPFPNVPDNMRPRKGGLTGDAYLNLGNQFFTLDSLHRVYGGDTVVFNIYIKDEADNMSNIITTDSIFVRK